MAYSPIDEQGCRQHNLETRKWELCDMSNDPTIPPTQPTIETILDRINALGESLSAEIVKVRTDLSAEIEMLRGELQSFRAETLEKLAKIDEKFEVIADDLLEIRAKQKQH